MHRFAVMGAALLWLSLACAPAQAGDPARGKLKIDSERCQECHGVDGNASDNPDGLGNEGKFPKLAGQSPDYIIKQVHDFRSGARNHQTMYLMATAVSDEDLADIAAYFGSVERMHGEAHTTPPLAAQLYLEGDAERAIVPCASCHGEHGKGLPGNGPVLGGQHRRYLQKQLLDWRAHERSNHADGTMNRIAAALSDTEIEALADYLAAQ